MEKVQEKAERTYFVWRGLFGPDYNYAYPQNIGLLKPYISHQHSIGQPVYIIVEESKTDKLKPDYLLNKHKLYDTLRQIFKDEVNIVYNQPTEFKSEEFLGKPEVVLIGYDYKYDANQLEFGFPVDQFVVSKLNHKPKTSFFKPPENPHYKEIKNRVFVGVDFTDVETTSERNYEHATIYPVYQGKPGLFEEALQSLLKGEPRAGEDKKTKSQFLYESYKYVAEHLHPSKDTNQDIAMSLVFYAAVSTIAVGSKFTGLLQSAKFAEKIRDEDIMNWTAIPEAARRGLGETFVQLSKVSNFIYNTLVSLRSQKITWDALKTAFQKRGINIYDRNNRKMLMVFLVLGSTKSIPQIQYVLDVAGDVWKYLLMAPTVIDATAQAARGLMSLLDSDHDAKAAARFKQELLTILNHSLPKPLDLINIQTLSKGGKYVRPYPLVQKIVTGTFGAAAIACYLPANLTAAEEAMVKLATTWGLSLLMPPASALENLWFLPKLLFASAPPISTLAITGLLWASTVFMINQAVDKLLIPPALPSNDNPKKLHRIDQTSPKFEMGMQIIAAFFGLFTIFGAAGVINSKMLFGNLSSTIAGLFAAAPLNTTDFYEVLMQAANYTLEQKCLRKFEHEKVIGEDFVTFLKNSMTRLADIKATQFVRQYTDFKSVDEIPDVVDSMETQVKSRGVYVSDGPLVYQTNQEFEDLTFHLERIRQYGDAESYQDFLARYKEELKTAPVIPADAIAVDVDGETSPLVPDALLEVETAKSYCGGCGVM